MKVTEYEKELNSPQLTEVTERGPRLRKIVKVWISNLKRYNIDIFLILLIPNFSKFDFSLFLEEIFWLTFYIREHLKAYSKLIKELIQKSIVGVVKLKSHRLNKIIIISMEEP